MIAPQPIAGRHAEDEIAGLVRRLHETQRRLQELAGGEVDAVIHPDGHSYLLHSAQEKLRENEIVQRDFATTQSSILNALPAHIALLDGQGVITSVNEGWQRFSGANDGLGSASSSLGKNYLEICGQAEGAGSTDAHAAAAGIRSVLRGTTEGFTLDYPCHGPDGQRWFQLRVNPMGSPAPCGVVVMHVDITERKRAEETLLRRQSELQAVFDLVPAMILVKDAKNGYLRVNQRAADQMGMRLEEIEGKNAYEIFPQHADAFYSSDMETLESGAPTIGIPEKMSGPQGEERWFQSDRVPCRDAEGKVVGLVVMVHDVTERQQKERTLRESEERLRFLHNLAEATRPLADASQIMAVAVRMLGVHLKVSGCLYAEPGRGGEPFRIRHRYTDGCVSPLAGQDLAHLGAEAAATLQGGQTLVIRGVDTELGTEERAEILRALDVQAVICCPLVREGLPRALMMVQQSTGRDWQASEAALVEEVLERCWSMMERRTSEEALRESEALLRMASRTAHLGGWAADLPPVLVTWSDEVCAIHEEPPGTTPGLDQAIGYYSPESRETVGRAFAACAESGKPFDLELEITTAKGRHVLVRSIGEARRNSAGVITRVHGAFQDITERKLAEQEVRLNEQRYRSLVEATTAIVWDTPASGEFEVAQPGWSAFTGQTFAELRGWGWLDAIHPEDREETARVWSAAVASRSPYQVEHRLVTPDGTYRDMTVRGVPILSEDGEIVQWVGIHTDVTERKNLEQQFFRSQRMESIGTLAGGIAHDLNNSLSPIILSLELLAEKFTDDESQELLEIVSTSARRGSDMVRQVLSFSRGVEGERQEVQLCHLVKDLVKIVNDTFLKHIEVRTHIPGDLWTVVGDSTQLHQVMLNLCVNARDAMPSSGTLTIDAENVVLDEQYAAQYPEAHPGAYVMLQVKDTGTGIPPAIIEKIFDPFFTTKDIGQGTGLGLSTTLAIVKSHGGFVRVQSELKKGTTFQVFLPGHPDALTLPSLDRTAELPRGNGEMILVVDDESAIRLVTRQTLEAFGYRVLLAGDGVEAVALYAARGAEISVVLTDMMMPFMDGPSTIQILRNFNPSLRVIAASGVGANSGGKFANLDVRHFLPKPYTSEVLLKALREILGE